MKKALIVAVFAVVAMFFSSLAFAGGPPQVDFKGSVMMFPKEDGITNLNLSALKFDFSEIPKEFSFMKGKVYRGQFTRMDRRNNGTLMYLFFLRKDANGIIFSTSTKKKHYEITCPLDILENAGFRCGSEESSEKTKYKLTIRKVKAKERVYEILTMDSDNGHGADFQEAGELPKQFLEQK